MNMFAEGNKDDLHAAIDGLNQFTKNWCMDVAATNAGELTFKCNQCPFVYEGGRCMVKRFVLDKDQEYGEKVHFGCMGGPV